MTTDTSAVTTWRVINLGIVNKVIWVTFQGSFTKTLLTFVVFSALSYAKGQVLSSVLRNCRKIWETSLTKIRFTLSSTAVYRVNELVQSNNRAARLGGSSDRLILTLPTFITIETHYLAANANFITLYTITHASPLELFST